MFDFNDPDSDSSVALKAAVPVKECSLPQATVTSNRNVAHAAATKQVRSSGPQLHPIYFPIKHFVERVFAVVLLVALAPLILVLIGLVRLTSRGPGIYRQERVGLNRKTFDVLKLRTMVQDAEADGQAKWSQKGDPRITPLGRFLRKTHLDELPQLWNVVAGDMSLTGPRPERPSICSKLSAHIDDYYSRTQVKPGITGLAQINLEPDRTIDDVRRKQCLDMDYIQNANPWLDARMIFATMLRMIGIRGDVVMRWMGLCRKNVIVAAGLSEAQLSREADQSSFSEEHVVSAEQFESMVEVNVGSADGHTAPKRRLEIDRARRPR